eukprot:2431401-Pyramimonas_sp.AAC.1
MVLATDRSVLENRAVRASLLGWRSSKLRRRFPSTLAGETLVLAPAVAGSLSRCYTETLCISL